MARLPRPGWPPVSSRAAPTSAPRAPSSGSRPFATALAALVVVSHPAHAGVNDGQGSQGGSGGAGGATTEGRQESPRDECGRAGDLGPGPADDFPPVGAERILTELLRPEDVWVGVLEPTIELAEGPEVRPGEVRAEVAHHVLENRPRHALGGQPHPRHRLAGAFTAGVCERDHPRHPRLSTTPATTNQVEELLLGSGAEPQG